MCHQRRGRRRHHCQFHCQDRDRIGFSFGLDDCCRSCPSASFHPPGIGDFQHGNWPIDALRVRRGCCMRRSGYILRATNATAPTDLSPGWRLQSMLTPLALIGPPHLAESRTQGAPKQETRGSQACDKGYARTQPRPRDQQSVPFLLLLTIDLSGRPVATSRPWTRSGRRPRA